MVRRCPAFALAELVDARHCAAVELAADTLLEPALLEEALQGGHFGASRTDLERGILCERHLHAARFRFGRRHRTLADVHEVLVDVDLHAAIAHRHAVVVLVNSLVVLPS